MASQRYRQRQRQRQRQCNGQRDTGEKFAEHQMQRLDRRRHEEFEGAARRFSLHMRIVIARLMMMTRSQIACTS